MNRYNHSMNTLILLQEWILRAISETDLIYDNADTVFEFSSDDTKSDFVSLICMKIAKKNGKSPIQIYEILQPALSLAQPDSVMDLHFALPGFLNVSLSKSGIGQIFQSSFTQTSETWVIEHTSPNTNKPLHLGHMRNNIVSESLISFLKHIRGDNVVADCINNDRGISIARAMWGYLKFQKKEREWNGDIKEWIQNPSEWYVPYEKNIKTDHFVGECYIAGSQDCIAFTDSEQAVRNMVIAWEAGDLNQHQLWILILTWYYKGRNETLLKLNSHFDNEWNESDHYRRGKEYVDMGIKNGVFKVLPDGGVLTDLEEKHGLSDTVVLKNDGTSLYITQDIALTDLKKKKWPMADHFVWVIGPEQSLQMKQLFAICEDLGIGKKQEFMHLSYGYVGLKTNAGFAKMSSRDGNVVLCDDLIEAVSERVTDKFNESLKKREYNKETIDTIALASIKFALLKASRTIDIAFDIDESVSLTGDSGAYVLYTYARIQSLLAKIGATETVNDWHDECTPLIRKIMRKLGVYSKIEKDLSTHHACHYVLELCHLFNAWYAKTPIITEDSIVNSMNCYVLGLLRGTIFEIMNQVLHIDVVDEM